MRRDSTLPTSPAGIYCNSDVQLCLELNPSLHPPATKLKSVQCLLTVTLAAVEKTTLFPPLMQPLSNLASCKYPGAAVRLVLSFLKESNFGSKPWTASAPASREATTSPIYHPLLSSLLSSGIVTESSQPPSPPLLFGGSTSRVVSLQRSARRSEPTRSTSTPAQVSDTSASLPDGRQRRTQATASSIAN